MTESQMVEAAREFATELYGTAWDLGHFQNHIVGYTKKVAQSVLAPVQAVAKNVHHCDKCGGSYYDDGMVNLDCPCSVTAERDKYKEDAEKWLRITQRLFKQRQILVHGHEYEDKYDNEILMAIREKDEWPDFVAALKEAGDDGLGK